MIYALLSGAVSTLCLLAATLFLRSFKRTRDRFFVLFAAAFVVLAFSQLALGLLNKPEADLPLVYIPRLISSLFIIAAIADKNRAAKRTGGALRLVHGGKQQQRHAVR